MAKTLVLSLAVLALVVSAALADPSGTNVVVNEIYCNPPGDYDGAEYIELYNPTLNPINIGGWVLCGPEFDQACGGEDRWQFPVGTTILSHAYIIVAKDANETGIVGNDSFFLEFGFNPHFELFDPSFVHDNDHLGTPNLALLDNDPATYYSDEIGLVGGSGYGVRCGGYSNADVVYLYTGAALITLVDLVEYANMSVCIADPCAGDDGVDNNAFPQIPFLGNTLGRSPTGGDTDNSDVDFQMMVPTPGAANVYNTPPWIRDVRYSPIPPNQTHTTDISATVTDDGAVALVKVYYKVGAGAWQNVTSTAAPGDSVYVGHIPIQPNGSQVQYYVRATDDEGASINYPGEGANDPYAFSVGYTTIRAIQLVPDNQNDSPLVGKAVNVRGIVTAAKGLFSNSICMIHEGTGDFRGIKCYVPGHEGEINEGDDITICGTVSEYYGETEVYLHFPEAIVVHSSGNPNYGYTSVTTAQIAPDDTTGISEDWEGQLVKVTNATVTFEPDAYGQWYVRDSSGVDAQVDDYAYYAYDAEVLDLITELRGVVMYSFDQYKIEPRYDPDIIGPPRIGDVRYSPVPPAAGQQVTITADLNDNVSISSSTLYWGYASGGPFTAKPMSRIARGDEVWATSIGPFLSGTRVYYYVECTDATMDARKPLEGSYSFYVGLLEIYDVQYVDPGGDPSPLDGLAANVQGYVTAEPGVYSPNTFWIAETDGAWHAVKIYDRTGTLTFKRGDYVTCCGQVSEYFSAQTSVYGETEIELHFPEAAVLSTPPPPREEPVGSVDLDTGLLQNVVSGEQYEGVYVHAQDCIVYDADLGYGEWAISNGAASDTCRVDDYADYTYAPVLNDNVWVKGIVMFAHGNYKIEPRGDSDIAVNPVGIPDGSAERRFGLSQNLPNPFNPKTSIAFSLAEPSEVVLAIYDVSGRKVATLVNERLDAGPHHVDWDGRTDSGDRVASGVYFYKLAAGERDVSRKMVLLK